jgi:hypothetical protein
MDMEVFEDYRLIGLRQLHTYWRIRGSKKRTGLGLKTNKSDQAYVLLISAETPYRAIHEKTTQSDF